VLWLQGGQLRYRAPKGVLSREELERITAYRHEIVGFLQRSAGLYDSAADNQSHPASNRAPLTFSQLAHWNLYRLAHRSAIRQVVCAKRLRGRLNVEALQKSLNSVMQRHDALRTRIVVVDGIPTQVVSEEAHCEISIADVTRPWRDSSDSEVQRHIHELIMEPIDLSVGPLFGVRLLKTANEDHVLIIVMEHMISDAFSIGIVERELLTGYVQSLLGRPLSLPPVQLRFTEYAKRQRQNDDFLMQKGAEYWRKSLEVCQRTRFPDDVVSPQGRPGWGELPVRIGSRLKRGLHEWCRREHTTAAIAALTVYAALVLRWCGVDESVVLLQVDGRLSSEVENTVGYVSFPLYLRISLRSDDSWRGLLERVTTEYCSAHEHADFSFMESRIPAPDFTRNTRFNWIPQVGFGEQCLLPGSRDALACSPVPFIHPMRRELDRDWEPSMQLFETADEVAGELLFPLSRFSHASMRKFADNFILLMEDLLNQPEGRVADALTG